ncbi:DUF805 domain-containing protein [Gilliamella sp. Pas-s25]|uniref:DUF805 domain-containing protein n=1 Tax=Gilliamella sp. Pas-s25 TaxID=2687310 RepID=UPI00135E2EA3|nr:DUF805 domain-containing protein [Gilliamella sp. Pas-s25]MWP62613.1 DUF805 domain-containing protein [Gilliamella sp. Pas-s25]
MNWFIDCITKNYANFNGRARRKEYWMFVLFSVILAVLTIIIDKIIGNDLMIVTCILSLALLLPNLAVTVRRLHDTNKSGWWILLQFIPYVGGIIILVLCMLDSTPGSNQYGENPKGM